MDNSELKNTSEKENIQDLGITIDSDLKYFENNKSEYKKMNNSFVDGLNLLLQAAPNVVDGISYHGEIYRAIYDKSLGELQKSAANPKYVRGNVVKKGTNNEIIGQAEYAQISAAPQIINGIFTVMSIAVGQYFMTKIDKELNQIQKDTEAILEFLQIDKYCKLEAAEETLIHVQETLNYVMQDDVKRQATLVTVNEIKKDALSDMKFFKKATLETLQKKSQHLKTNEVINEYLDEMGNNISVYWYSLYLYSFAGCLDVILTKNYDKDYLAIIKKDLESKFKQYKNFCTTEKKNLKYFMEVTNLYDPDQKGKLNNNENIFEAIGKIVKDPNHREPKLTPKEMKKGVLGKINKLGENTEIIEEKIKDIDFIDSFYNEKLELIKKDDEVYFRTIK